MKIYIVFIAYLLTITGALAQDIPDSVVAQYHDKSKVAFSKAENDSTRDNWLEALKYLFVYRELSTINKADESALKKIDEFIKKAENKAFEGDAQHYTNTTVLGVKETGARGGWTGVLKQGSESR